MRIRKGDVIKHRNSMDVCFKVVSIYEGSDSWKIKGYWMNQGFHESWYLFANTTNIAIKKDNVKDLLYTDKLHYCYRHADWKYYV